MQKKIKKPIFKIQDRPDVRDFHVPEDTKNLPESQGEDTNAKQLEEMLEATDEKLILQFANQVLNQKLLPTKQAVLDYMLNSSSSDAGLRYFLAELTEFLQLVQPPPLEEEAQAKDKREREPEPEEGEGEEEESWDVAFGEGGDPVEFMQKNFQEAKKRLEEMLDRITICEARLDSHDTNFESISGSLKAVAELKDQFNKGNNVVTVSKSVYENLTDRLNELEAKIANGVGVGASAGEYIIRFPEGKVNKIKAVLPPCWDMLLDLATTRQNIFLAGPTQCGKTKTAEMLAEALGLRFSAMSCSEGLGEEVFAGTLLPIGEGGKFEYLQSTFVDFYENGGVFLLDEICGMDANLGTNCNNALGNDHFFLQRRWKNPLCVRHPDFICIAADNTLGFGGDDMYVGRNQLDASLIERFKTGRIMMDYSPKIEKSISDEEVYEWAVMIRKAINALKYNKTMSTTTMKNFSVLKRERNWDLRKIESVYFADWPKDDVKTLMGWIKRELEQSMQKVKAQMDSGRTT